MLIVKRLMGLIIVTLFLGFLFLIYALGDNKDTMHTVQNEAADHATMLVREEAMPVVEKESIYLIGKDNAIMRNIGSWFMRWNISYETAEYITDEGIQQDAIYIFCEPKIEKLVSLVTITDFVSQGGKMILAAGLSEGYVDSYIIPLLGIIEKGIQKSSASFTVADGFLPFYETSMEYSGFASMHWLALDEDAIIYMTDTDSDAPIVYQYPFGEGKTMVFNTPLLSDPLTSGIFASAYGELVGDFIYPIMGTKTVFLDNFPIVTNINDSECLRLYGRSTESFVSDKVWPMFEGLGIRNNIAFTSSVLTVVTGDLTFPRGNQKLFYDISHSTIEHNGEVIFAADLSEEIDLTFYDAFEVEFREMFPTYQVKGLSIQSGSLSEKIREDIQAHYPDVTILRGYLTGDEKKTYINDIAHSERYYQYPVFTSGSELTTGIWDIAMGVSGYGALSHKYEINSMMGIGGNGLTWEQNVDNIAAFEERVYQKLEWLEPRTLSGLQTRIDTLTQLEVEIIKEDNMMYLYANNVEQGQPFFFRTKGKIDSAIGVEYEQIADGYYILKFITTDAVVTFEE